VKRNIFAGGTGQDFRARARRANQSAGPFDPRAKNLKVLLLDLQGGPSGNHTFPT
jgi:hypothetical protein